MKHTIYKVTVPVDDIRLPDPLLAVTVLDMGHNEWNDMQMERQLRRYFVNHFTQEFERIYQTMIDNAEVIEIASRSMFDQWPVEAEILEE